MLVCFVFLKSLKFKNGNSLNLSPSELHLLTGPVNAIMTAMEQEWPGVSSWTNAINVDKDDYYGGTFTGNKCKKLLQETDLLRSICPPHILKYVDVLQTFEAVVNSCYGNALSHDYKTCIDAFRVAYQGLDIPITPKVHCIIHHVGQFCSKFSCGLGRHSEQASESVHARFKETWSKYKLPKCHDNYKFALLKAVKEFNCYRF